MLNKNNIYYFLRESDDDLDFVFRESFLLKFIAVLFLIAIPLQSRQSNKREEGRKRKKKNGNYRVITGNYVPMIEARLILDPNRCRRRISTCSPIVS